MYRTADHPRMRGERTASIRAIKSANGSSPHARGTLPSTHQPHCSGRIIPACAGNAFCPIDPASRLADHPRMRGERTPCRVCLACVIGSSPHARGTLYQVLRCSFPFRIIPACAGNATYSETPDSPHPDHPRMRGERSRAPGAQLRSPGSSPHARGTLARAGRSTSISRIIPACAGNAYVSPFRGRTSTDHPRMRGERSNVRASLFVAAGSSPHARGTRQSRSR